MEMTREEKINEVLRMWNEKFTSYQIAMAIGITRNAVMGIVHRHGKRKTPKKVVVRRVTPKVAEPKPEPKKRAAPKKEEKLTVFRKRIKATEPFPELTFKITKGKKMMDLGPFDCRWIWDDSSYCGKPTDMCSYCTYHKTIVYVPPRKKENR
jgi:hypothetical protein